MVAITSLLVLACAVAINAVALPGACTKAQIGHPYGPAHKMQRVYLKPGIADWEVKIPGREICLLGVAGVVATVCDSDVEPSANFISEQLLYVHRNGQLYDYATVDVTIYCIALDQQLPFNKPHGWNGALTSPRLYDHQPGLIALPQ